MAILGENSLAKNHHWEWPTGGASHHLTWGREMRGENSWPSRFSKQQKSDWVKLDHFPKKSYGSFPPTNPIWIISPKKLGVNIKAIKEKNEVSPHHLGKMAGRQGNCATISRRNFWNFRRCTGLNNGVDDGPAQDKIIHERFWKVR